MSSTFIRYALPTLLAAVATASPCVAQDIAPNIAYVGGYTSSYGQAGYGGNLVDGSYVGAPLTRTPTPREIVPSPWSYGTYGVPTVSGIRRAPVGEPVVYVIEGARPATRNQARTNSRSLSRNGADRWSEVPEDAGRGTSGGARVVQVRVPAR